MSTSTDSAEPASRTRLVTWKEPVVDVAQIAAMSREHTCLIFPIGDDRKQ
jgi:hypothetical protein